MAHPAFSFQNEIHCGGARFDLLHHHSGAVVLHQKCDPTPYGFAIGFPTPARDDTGLTHVLEHMVFRGSKLHGDDHLYAALRSGSLAYHLNASTGPEVSSYHFATPSLFDALRLQEALLAAVFHPLLRQKAFQQEAFDAQSGKPGIVHNEMLGHLAALPARLDHALRRSLFGQAPAGWCYGGNPQDLKTLSLSALRQYHHHFYHPASALVLLTGADDDGRRLGHLDQAFRPFERRQSPLPPEVAPHFTKGALLGHSYWGMIFPKDLQQGEKQLLAQVILQKAKAEFGALLLPQSGFVDAFQPYIALYWQGEEEINFADWARNIETSCFDEASQALAARASDDEADPRLPANLQPWPAFCAAHLRGDLTQTFAPLPQPSQALCQKLKVIAASLSYKEETTAKAMAPPPNKPLTAPKPIGFFRPPDLSDIGEIGALPEVSVSHPIALLPREDSGFVRICLWCDAGALDLEKCRLLPRLAASARATLGAKVQCHNASQAGLLIEARLHISTVAQWLERCELWFSDPPPIPATEQIPLPLAAEIHLRAGFIAAWHRVAQTIGLKAPDLAQDAQNLRDLAVDLRKSVKAATTAKEVLTSLADWTGSSPPPHVVPPCPKGRDSVIAFESALFTIGFGLDFRDIPQEHLFIARKAIEADYLWPELRSKAGSYGLRTSQQDGIFTMISVRDPQGPRSLDIMADAGHWLASQARDPKILQRAKLAALAEHLRPQPTSALLREALLPPRPPLSKARLLQAGPEVLQNLAQEMIARRPQAQRLLIASHETLTAHGLRPDR